MSNYTTLFLDIGNVLLTNGWDHKMRLRAVKDFFLDEAEMNARHALVFDTYEIGKITLDEYIERVIFYEPRTFTLETFKNYMFEQSLAIEPMIQLVKEFKSLHSLRVVALTNEGKELMEYRVNKFDLKQIFDLFVCSSFVHLKKPDVEIYKLALSIAQVDPKEVIYIDDRKMLIEVGRDLNITCIHHETYEQTKVMLSAYLT